MRTGNICVLQSLAGPSLDNRCELQTSHERNREKERRNSNKEMKETKIRRGKDWLI